MAPNYNEWQNPLNSRYCSEEMKKLWSPRRRAETWRQLWYWLAEAQHELGLEKVTDEALSQMASNLELKDEEFAVIANEERRRKHDVMAHLFAYGLRAPSAEGIIHWGATSCYITDNADLILLRDGLGMLLPALAGVIQKLTTFARQWKDQPCLSYTHGQSASPTTVGRRACVWIQDLLMDLRNIEHVKSGLRFRGVKGATGTQGTFLKQFGGDHDKVEKLDELVTKKAGFDSAFTICTQTYTRKIDVDVISALSSFGATCQRIAGDVRHLAMFKEMEEPFGADQIGSSAMAYKRNPMLAERCTSLGRKLMNLVMDALSTYSAQWFERTLDDSAIRRISIPEAFLTAEANLRILDTLCSDFCVYPAVINRRLAEDMPFLATENIITALVNKGISRNAAHEEIRVLSQQASQAYKLHGLPNDLFERLRNTKFFEPIHDQLDDLLDPEAYIGRSPQQVEKFTGPGGEVEKALERYQGALKERGKVDLKV